MHSLDFPLWLRALYFCNLLFVTLLIRSGLEILSATASGGAFGFMMVKHIKEIGFIADYTTIGEGQGGWREDHQFYSPEAGV